VNMFGSFEFSNVSSKSVRELASAVGFDVKRVHEDVVILAELGMLERTEGGGVLCPYSSMHIDMYLKAA
jgi:predicted transcriptional regulator